MLLKHKFAPYLGAQNESQIDAVNQGRLSSEMLRLLAYISSTYRVWIIQS